MEVWWDVYSGKIDEGWKERIEGGKRWQWDVDRAGIDVGWGNGQHGYVIEKGLYKCMG